jgi:ABC-type uncharacterized transport system substrate-binding protein
VLGSLHIKPAMKRTERESTRYRLDVGWDRCGDDMELQYAEEQNFVIEYRSPEGRASRFPDLAHELVRLKVDLILTRGTPAVTAAKNATRTIPIVMAASGDPLGAGVVTGLARPGGNVTGLTALTAEVSGKRLQLLKEAIPGARRLAAVLDRGAPVDSMASDGASGSLDWAPGSGSLHREG